MLQMYFAFLNVESIRGFSSTFVAIFSATSYPFDLKPRSKRPPLDILKLIFTAFINQDKKASFVLVDEDTALVISSYFVRTYHNNKITVQTNGGDVYSLNGKS